MPDDGKSENCFVSVEFVLQSTGYKETLLSQKMLNSVPLQRRQE